MSSLGDYRDVDDAARAAVGNWQRFDSFGWHERPADPDQWCIVYTHNRDSGLLDQSNADAIAKTLAPFLDADCEDDERDIYGEHHDHWACGWVDGYAIRVYRNGTITPAFRAYHELAARLSDYPVLDEYDYSNREHEATLENITSAARSRASSLDIELPDDYPSLLFSWFWDNCQRAVESRDDNGGYPSDDELDRAFCALGWGEWEDDDSGPESTTADARTPSLFD